MVPAPVITTLRYPDYIRPTLEAGLTGSRIAEHHDRAWRFLQTGDLGSAEREVDAALQLQPRFPPSETAAGYVALARGEADQALERFDAAIAGATGYVPALVGRGHSLAELGRASEAVAAYQSALAVDPTLPNLQRRSDVLQFRALEERLDDAREAARDGRLDIAAAAYNEVLATSPDSSIFHRELADVEERRGNGAVAVRHFERAIELDAADSVSHFRIGRIREAQGDLSAAIRSYEAAARIDRSPLVLETLEAARGRLELSKLPAQYQAIPSSPQVTRAALAALIGVRLASVVAPSGGTTPVVLTDVRSTWAEPWIMTVTQAGVMDGYENHTFQPETSVPRIDLARVISEILPRVVPQPALSAWQAERRVFADLSPAHLAYPAASTAIASGVMTTGPGDRFEPSRPVTGTEAMAAIERLEALAAASRTSSAGR